MFFLQKKLFFAICAENCVWDWGEMGRATIRGAPTGGMADGVQRSDTGDHIGSPLRGVEDRVQRAKKLITENGNQFRIVLKLHLRYGAI